jgi:pimeloyl-ACP methyl ester carboxylesterase
MTTATPIEGPWEHEQVVANDLRMHYVEAGAGDPVVFLHGFPEFWYSWREQLPAFADAGYRAIAPDLRGYNRTEAPPGVSSYRLDRLVDDIVALVEQCCDGSTTIVGHDWGGMIAWELAAREPAVVDQLVIMNAPHPRVYQRELTNLDQLLDSWYIFYFQLPWLPEYLLGAFDSRLLGRAFTETAVTPETFSPAELDQYREALHGPDELSGPINYYRALFRSVLRDGHTPLVPEYKTHPGAPQAEHIDVPTLLCWGLRDTALVSELSVGVDEWVADLTVERFPEASHWLQHDCPEAVTETVLEWL